MSSSRRLLCLATSLLLCSCAHLGASTARLTEAAKAAQSPNATARSLALAGFHALLVEGDAGRAGDRFAAALVKDDSDPYARLGNVMLAQRSGHPEKALEEALLLLERSAPSHPLQIVAAREVAEMVGQSLPLDEQIVHRVGPVLEHGLPGEAAHLLRGAMSVIALNRGDLVRLQMLQEDTGAVSKVSLVGPLSALHVLSFDETLPPEKTGTLDEFTTGAVGPQPLRTLHFPDGRIQLSGETPIGDGYIVAVDVDVPVEALHVLRTVGVQSHRVTVDGTQVLSRPVFLRATPTVSAVGLRLTPGKHRIVLKLLGDERGGLSLALPRADGKPAGLRFTPARGPAPQWKGIGISAASGFVPRAEMLVDALRPEAGEGLARFIAARDAVGRDRDGVKALLDLLDVELPSAAVGTVGALLALGDRTLPPRIAHGRSISALESALQRDPKNVEALLMRANAAVDDSQLTEASDLVTRARAAFTPPGYPVLLLQARLGFSLNVAAQAELAAQEALNIQPGLCEALSLRFELAQRQDAAKRADGLLDAVKGCPHALPRSVEHARTRGDLPRAIQDAEALLQREPASPTTAIRLASLYVGQRRFPDALKALRTEESQWPREAMLRKREAEVLALSGDAKGALAAREQALLLDGDDLPLRRLVERTKSGHELLQEYATDGEQAIAAYQAKPGPEDSAGAYVLDAAAMRAFPDGAMVDRIHVIQKVLDPSAVAEIAEVNIPQGAQVLKLRTIKADGRTLEPESFEGKEAISLPGVAVGDFVEYEYLFAHNPRSPLAPGFTASNFYFQIARQPDHDVTYTVVAPQSLGMKVDAHHMQAPAPKVEGKESIFQLTLHDQPPFIPEPDSPPSINEFLPFVSVGAGAEGNEGLMWAYGDALSDRAKLTAELQAFAREAGKGKSGGALVTALYGAVMEKVSGKDEGLGASAAATLAQERGSRLWLLKALLEASGIETRIALVRPFGADPSPYLFPNETLFSYAVLRLQLGGSELWLDPTLRYAPLGDLREQIAGGREAYLLPEPGRPLKRATTPGTGGHIGKQVHLDLTIDAEGTLTGTGLEQYGGIEAAQLSEALAALSPEEREQAVQSALTRFFGGAELSELKVERDHAVGATLNVHYRLRAPRFARTEEGRVILPPVTFPAFLGKRYVQLSQRHTTLFVDDTERNTVSVTLHVPPGYKLSGPVGDVRTGSPFGMVRRQESQKGQVVEIHEDYRLDMGRIAPERYEEFSQFAGEVDLLQSRDLVLEGPPKKGLASARSL